MLMQLPHCSGSVRPQPWSGVSGMPSAKHQPQGSPPDWSATTGWPVCSKWLRMWRRGDDSQQLVRPHTRHRRNSTHVVPWSRQSWQAAGGSAGSSGSKF